MKKMTALLTVLTCLLVAPGSLSYVALANDAVWQEIALSLNEQLGDQYPLLGKIQQRDAKEIASSNWSLGAETMDRDYTIYKNWRKYLGPLGAKKARIQSGWAKTEKEPGTYDWAWVDEIVLDMVDQGVEPWVCLCYGNPIYPGGGDTGLGGGLVSSEEALQAWERYVAAFVRRYGKHVNEWEVWNEPRTGRGKGTIQYGNFVIRTAETIREIQPESKIFFAAGGSFHPEFAREVLEHLEQNEKLGLVDRIIYHPYAHNPDSRQDAALQLRVMARSFASHIDIYQGENGAPSVSGGFGAISSGDWTEKTQAKWLLRRLLGDLGHDIPSSYFAICEMKYPTRINYKGLLSINDDRTIHHVKLGYYTMQHVTALFDDSIKRIRDAKVRVEAEREDSKIESFAYRGPAGGVLITLWRKNDMPDADPSFERAKVSIAGESFADPVWVDMLTGRVYDIPQSDYKVAASGTTFSNVPVYDSVVVVAERAEIDRVLGDAKE